MYIQGIKRPAQALILNKLNKKKKVLDITI